MWLNLVQSLSKSTYICKSTVILLLAYQGHQFENDAPHDCAPQGAPLPLEVHLCTSKWSNYLAGAVAE